MIWITPSEKDTDIAALEKRLWDAADTRTCVSANPECEATWRDFREAKDHWSANSGLKSQETTPRLFSASSFSGSPKSALPPSAPTRETPTHQSERVTVHE